MGAFDTYADSSRCPRCGDLREVSGQNSFFVPRFTGLHSRHFEPGQARLLDFELARLEVRGLWNFDWWRLREPVGGNTLELLADFDEAIHCDCGAYLGAVLRFELAAGPPPKATLIELTLREFMDPRVLDVDFSTAPPSPELNEFAVRALPLEKRRALVRQCLDEELAADQALGTRSSEPWTWIIGEVHCESCGDVRVRKQLSSLTHSYYVQGFFGPSWTGGTLSPGMTVACEVGWLDEDVDRGFYARLRHPLPSDRVKVMLKRRSQGCHCGVGQGVFVLDFLRGPEGLTLTRVSLRSVSGASDLADIDFAEAFFLSRDRPSQAAFLEPSRSPQKTREEVFQAVLEDLRG